MNLMMALVLACAMSLYADSTKAAPRTSKSTLDGLSASVTAAVRTRDGGMLLRYHLQYTDSRHLWMLKELEPLKIVFWDAKGTRVGKAVYTYIALDQAFLENRIKSMYSPAGVNAVPPGAHFFTVELGASGLVTDKVPIPRK